MLVDTAACVLGTEEIADVALADSVRLAKSHEQNPSCMKGPSR